MAPRLDYRPPTRDQMKKRAAQTGSSREGYIKENVRVWTPTEGEHRVRILPPTWADANHFGLDVFAHYGIGMEGSTFACLDNPPHGHKKQTCPVCEERKRAQEAGEDELAYALRPNKRVLVWMIDRDHESDGPQIWPMPYTIDRDLANLVIDPEGDGVYPIDNPDDGYDLYFKREGKNQRTKYMGVKLSRNSSYMARDKQDQDDWLQYILDNPLPDCVVMATPAHIEDELSAGVRINKDAGQQRGGGGRDRDDERGRGRDDERRGRDDERGRDGAGGSRMARTGGSRDREDDRGRDRGRERARAPAKPRSYDELERMSEDEMIALAESQDIRLNDRLPILGQLALEFGFDDRPSRGGHDERGSSESRRDDRGSRRDGERDRGRDTRDDDRSRSRDDDRDSSRDRDRGRDTRDDDRGSRDRGRDIRDDDRGSRGRDDDRGRSRDNRDDDLTRDGRRDIRDDDRSRSRDDDRGRDDRGSDRDREGSRVNRLREGTRGVRD
jgi:hypothetical protein